MMSLFLMSRRALNLKRCPSNAWSWTSKVRMNACRCLRSDLLALACLSVFCPTGLHAADDIDLFRAREDQGYFVRASGKALFNVGVSVETVRPVYGPGEYANGYVLPDIGGSSLTWNWGYESPAQVVGDQLTFERYDNLPPLGTQDERVIAPGGEVMAGVELGTFKLGKQTVRWGVEVGYGFNYLQVDTGSSGSSTVTNAVAVYSLNGITPPAAPYAGTFEGPGPYIGVMPVSTTNFVSASEASSAGELSGGLHNFKLGFWFDYPITDSLFTSLSLGYASVYADVQLKYTEALTYPDVTISNTIGGRDNWKPGFYAQWRLGYQISKRVDVFLGVDYQWNDKMMFSEADRNITLDFSAMFGASAGVQVNF